MFEASLNSNDAQVMASPLLRHGWSCSTLLSGIAHMDEDSLAMLEQELPEGADLEELQKAT